MKNSDELRQIRFFGVTDCTAMEEYLEEMAEKGWALKTASGNNYIFKKTEPKKLRYAVALFPKSSIYGGAPGSELQEYIDYCAAAGWQFVCTWSIINIFVAENDGVPPIETDEAGKLQTIINSIKKLYVFSLISVPIALLALLNVYFFTFQTAVVKNYILILLPLFPLVVFFILIQTICIWTWIRRQKARLSRGEPLRFYSLKAQQKRMKLSYGISFGLVAAWFAAGIAVLLLKNNWLDAFALLSLFVFASGIVLLTLIFGEQISRFIGKPLRMIALGAGIGAALSVLCVIGAIVYFIIAPVPAITTESSVLASKTDVYIDESCGGTVVIFKSPYEWICKTYLRRDAHYDPSGTSGNTAVWNADAVITSGGVTFVIYGDCVVRFPEDLSLTGGDIAVIRQNAGKSAGVSS